MALFPLYSMYVQTAEKVSDRRASLNSWMITLLNAVLALDVGIAKLAAPKLTAFAYFGGWIVPLMGMVTAVVWLALLDSFRALNSAKFKVILDLEKLMDVNLFQREQNHYREVGRTGFAKLERYIPLTFLAMFAVILAVRVFEL